MTAGPPFAPGRVRRALAAVRIAAGGVVAVSAFSAMLVRATVRDAAPPLALLFYLAAWPVVALELLAAAGLWRRFAPRASRMLLGAGLACLVPLGLESWRFAGPADSGGTHRVLLWNMCRGAAGWDALALEVAGHDADLLCLVESTDRGGRHPDWAELLPDFEVAHVRETTTIAVRGTILRARTVALGRGSDAGIADVRLRSGEELTVVAVDIHANPLVDRGPAMRALAQEIAALDGRPALMLGDFNLPPDSVHFDAIRRRMTNVFESQGNGYAATWPNPLPVLQLDQAWVNDRCDATQCRHRWTFRSDHRPVTFGVRVP